MSAITNRITKGTPLTIAEVDANFANLNTDKIETSAKDATGGIAGLTLFKLNLKNAANTFTNFLTNATTVARTWTLPDKDGIIALIGDVLPNVTNVFNNIAPNVTVNLAGIQAVASTTDAYLALLPKGNGGIGNEIQAVSPGLNTFSWGSGNLTSAQYSGALGVYNTIESTAATSLVIGQSNTILGNAEIFIGAGNIDSSATLCNQNISIGVGNTHNGANGIAIGDTNISDSAICIGSANTGLLGGLVLGGSSNQALVYLSTTVGGFYQTNTGQAAYTFGVNTQNSTAGKIAIGILADPNNLSIKAEQTGIFSASANTTTAQQFLSSDSLAAVPGINSGSNQLQLPDFSCIGFIGTITARKTGSTQVSGWKVEGLLSRGNGVATTILLSTITPLAGSTPLFGTPTLAADTTNGALKISAPATTQLVSWVAQLMTSETTVAS